MDHRIKGLTEREVLERRAAGEGNSSPGSVTKTKTQIFKENILTLFNLLNFGIAILLFAAKAYTNMVFIVIILLNIGIGIAQELKAKKLVDELSILNRPHITVLRDGREVTVETDEIVRDDVLVLESGKQICSDAMVLEGEAEINESLLTGESDAVVKQREDQLYSGSFVISGKCYAKVVHVGSENYATKLAEQVKQEKRTESELLGSMRKVTKMTSFLILPLGVFLFLESLFLRRADFDTSVVSSAAALLGMLPKGLVLLICVSLATGVIRLAKMKILVQNIYSLETLAHVDVLCLDKTGTITDGKMTVKDAIAMTDSWGKGKITQAESESLLRSYLAASDDNNATACALKQKFRPELSGQPVRRIPFSSKRKWGMVSFENKGSVFVGAPDKLFGECPREAALAMEEGFRVLAVGYSGQMWEEDELPDTILPLYLLIIEDTLRKNTKKTLEFFRREGVDVKIISGDHKKTVSMIAKKAGLKRWRDAVDLSELEGEIDYEQLCQEYAVFARVTPKQKQELVQALKRLGHHVAMTGDGVNDLLALREADCSIGVAEGSDASRQISQIVLLESDFSHLPQVVLEGRRVINNVTRTAGVFFIKTIYSVLVSLLCLVLNLPFPFIPIQITLVDACIEAYPSFLTIFESNMARPSGGFLKTALSNALPFGLAVTEIIAVVSLWKPFTEAENQTVMYLLLILISMSAVVKSCMPANKLRSFICVTMVAGTFGALFLLPGLFQTAALTPAMAAVIAGLYAQGILLTAAIFQWKKRRKYRMIEVLQEE